MSEDQVLERKIFDSFDTNKDGLLDQSDLDKSFPHGSERERQMQKWLAASDDNNDGKVDFAEFHAHVHKQLRDLRTVFDSVDINHDGKLDISEVKTTLEQLYGVLISPKSISSMMSHIDVDKDGFISFEEWVKYLVFLPVHNGNALRHIFDVWRDEACLDCGDSVLVPANTPTHTASLVAGGIAGAVSRTATAPLDRLKTLIQVHGAATRGGATTGIMAGMTQIWREGGMVAFFRGNFANCLKIAPESATKFFAYEYFKSRLHDLHGDKNPLLQKFVAGATAGVVSQLLVYPLDCLKVRMACSPVPMNIPQAVRNTYNSGGVPAFFRGVKACIIGVIPYAGIDLATYETLKSLFTDYSMQYLSRKNEDSAENKRKQNQHMSIAVPLVCGTISSTFAQFFAYPFALVRTKLQSQGIGEKYAGMGDAFRKILQKDGFFGLYKGMGPNLLKVVPAVSISYIVYERIKIALTAPKSST